jgi:hypothetical protein
MQRIFSHGWGPLSWAAEDRAQVADALVAGERSGERQVGVVMVVI